MHHNIHLNGRMCTNVQKMLLERIYPESDRRDGSRKIRTGVRQTDGYCPRMLLISVRRLEMFNFVGLKGRSEKSPCESGEMKAEPLRYYDKYITV